MPNDYKAMSWGWIIFWIILFWPVGLYFLYKKLNSDKGTILKSGNVMAIISYIFIGFAELYLLLSFTDKEMFSAFIFCGGIGLWLLIVSRKRRKNAKRYKKYITLIINQYQTLIDDIASAVGVSYEIAVKELQRMIDMGYFAGAYINEVNRQIVLPQAVTQQTSQTVNTQGQQARVVTCRSCGASNTVSAGQIKECEYCGSPLQ